MRICLRDDINYDKVTSLHSDLGNLLLKNTALYLYSDVVLTELLAAVRNFSKSVSKVAFIVKTNTNVLIKLAKLPPSDKIQQLAIQCLNNLASLPELQKHIQSVGGADLFVLMKSGGTGANIRDPEINKFNFQ